MSHSTSDLAQLVRERIEAWHAAGRADAAGVIAAHPELAGAKSLYMDLVVAEYEVRTAAGDEVHASAFCDQFPAHRQSVVHMLQVEEFLDRCPQFAARALPQRWPTSGERFLEYEIVEPLGRGGLARVFLARDLEIGGRFVVLKVSPFGGDEAATLGKVEHPSVVPIYSVRHDAASGLSAICMPLLGVATGIDLLDAAFGAAQKRPTGELMERVARDARPLTKVTLPPPEKAGFSWRLSYGEAVARLGLELAQGLAAAHARGILHRDIKPSNVLLAWSGRAMLLDFNLSTEANERAARIGGTLAYMAPENIASLISDQGEAASVFDPRCDVYSLGVVLYELLTGHLPHGAGNEQPRPDDYAGWLRSKQPAPPAIVRALADPRLAGIVHKCLALAPANRYQSADELAAALHAYLAPAARVQRFANRRRRELVLGAVALGLCATGLAAFIGSQPTQLEALHRQGLALYDEGQFAAAAERFSSCLELKPGWPPALFGRAQSLRRLGRFKEARNDYLGLKDVEPVWSYALAGYCNVRLNEFPAAWSDYQFADKQGISDVGSLLNFSFVQKRRLHYSEAADLCSRVLAIDPSNKHALRERSLLLLAKTVNDRSRVPEDQIFLDAAKYAQLENSYHGPYLTAIVFAEAAAKNPDYESGAIEHLTQALERGLPQRRLAQLPKKLKRLLPHLDARLVNDAPLEDASKEAPPTFEPSSVADWQTFVRQFGRGNNLIAATR